MPHYVLDARTATPHFPGIGSYCRSLAAALITLLSADEHLSILLASPYTLDLPPHPGVTSISLDISPFSLRQQWVIPRLLKQLEVDIYHSAYYLVPYLPGVPAVVTFYDLIPMRFPQYSTLRARLLFRLACKLALNTATRGIVISSTTRQNMVRYLSAEPDQLTLTHLAADPKFTPQPAGSVARIREKYALPQSFTLFLGSNKPHKNLENLVRAYASLRDLEIPLVIAGAWLPQYPGPRHLADSLGLDDSHIRWLGPVPGEDLPTLYSAASLFVFPSLVEGFGLPVIEAMACGTPVACSRIPSLVEVAGDAAELFDPTDIASLTAALRRVIEDTELQQSLRQRSLEQAALFSWQKTAQRTLDVYRSISSRKKARF